MRVKIFALTLFLFLSSYGQEYDKVSGYLGKRLLIGVDYKLGPSFEVQEQLDENSNASSSKLRLNKFLQAKIEYTTNTFSSIGISYTEHTTSAFISDDDYLNGVSWGPRVGTSSGPGNYKHTLTSIYGTPLIEDKAIGIYYRAFLGRRGAMAPAGTYVQLGLKLHNYTIDFSNMRYHSRSATEFGEYETLIFAHTQKVANLKYGEIDFAFGKRVPLTKRILLDYSVGGGVLSSVTDLESFMGNETVNKSDYRWDSPTQIGIIETKERLAKSHYLKCSIGISLLII